MHALYALRNNLPLTHLLKTQRVGAEGDRPRAIIRAQILRAVIRLAEFQMMYRRGKRCRSECAGAVVEGPRQRLLRRPQIQKWG